MPFEPNPNNPFTASTHRQATRSTKELGDHSVDGALELVVPEREDFYAVDDFNYNYWEIANLVANGIMPEPTTSQTWARSVDSKNEGFWQRSVNLTGDTMTGPLNIVTYSDSGSEISSINGVNVTFNNTTYEATLTTTTPIIVDSYWQDDQGLYRFTAYTDASGDRQLSITDPVFGRPVEKPDWADINGNTLRLFGYTVKNLGRFIVVDGSNANVGVYLFRNGNIIPQSGRETQISSSAINFSDSVMSKGNLTQAFHLHGRGPGLAIFCTGGGFQIQTSGVSNPPDWRPSGSGIDNLRPGSIHTETGQFIAGYLRQSDNDTGNASAYAPEGVYINPGRATMLTQGNYTNFNDMVFIGKSNNGGAVLEFGNTEYTWNGEVDFNSDKDAVSFSYNPNKYTTSIGTDLNGNSLYKHVMGPHLILKSSDNTRQMHYSDGVLGVERQTSGIALHPETDFIPRVQSITPDKGDIITLGKAPRANGLGQVLLRSGWQNNKVFLEAVVVADITGTKRRGMYVLPVDPTNMTGSIVDGIIHNPSTVREWRWLSMRCYVNDVNTYWSLVDGKMGMWARMRSGTSYQQGHRVGNLGLAGLAERWVQKTYQVGSIVTHEDAFWEATPSGSWTNNTAPSDNNQQWTRKDQIIGDDVETVLQLSWQGSLSDSGDLRLLVSQYNPGFSYVTWFADAPPLDDNAFLDFSPKQEDGRPTNTNIVSYAQYGDIPAATATSTQMQPPWVFTQWYTEDSGTPDLQDIVINGEGISINMNPSIEYVID